MAGPFDGPLAASLALTALATLLGALALRQAPARRPQGAMMVAAIVLPASLGQVSLTL